MKLEEIKKAIKNTDWEKLEIILMDQ